ncbi:hypothetical protein ACHQM5_010753 [Ranunculus cassubicifolius]
MSVMSLRPVVFVCIVISLVLSSSAQNQLCGGQTFTSNRIFSACNDLPVLNSFLHWSYDSTNRTVNLAYRLTNIDANRWVAWAINPTAATMVGSQALVAFQASGRMNAYTAPITSYGSTLQQGDLSFQVPAISAEYSNREMTIYATIVLPPGSTTVNQVWQEGPLSGNTPGPHVTSGANVQSMGRIDFQSGQTTQTVGGGVTSRTKRRNVHGVLNAVSWGTLMPLGAIIARHLKVAKSAGPAWYYIHVAIQTAAYSIGVSGWATGLKLGSDSVGIEYDTHRNIGITLFVLGTLQVFALLLRPKPDHKYRIYWKVYHTTVGYLVIILSIVNIYKGLDILDPEKKWKRIYTGVIIALAIIFALLEALTWMVVLKERKNEDKSHHGRNAANGVNGYGV